MLENSYSAYLLSLELSLFELFGLGLIVFIAAIVRGYAGFGFSAIVVAAASLYLPTREVVPIVLMLEILASLQMLRGIWRDINWRLVASILLSSVVFIPVGQYALLHSPVELMRLIAALLLFLAVWLNIKGFRFGLENSTVSWVSIGVVSGFMNGMLAMGGLWIMILLVSTGIKAVVLRASLVALFFLTDTYAIVVGAEQGLITQLSFNRMLWLLPALLLGVLIGARKFSGSRDISYKRFALGLLASLSVLLMLKSIALIL